MKILGITGNIGSGKSTASMYLKNKNSFIIDADKVGHSILQKNGVAYKEVINNFKDILDENDNIDRKKLGNIVFNDKGKLELLTTITHKHIINEINFMIKKAKQSDSYNFIVIDAPLLVDANLHKLCDYIIVVTSDLQTRIDRITNRDNVSKDIAIKKINSQKTNEELVIYADFVLENNGDLCQLYTKIEEILSNIKGEI